MQSLILCGGKGTRAYPHTVELPKPLLEVAGRPVLQHVMEIYARQGHTNFVLAAGYKAEMIEQFAAGLPSSWTVDVVQTGEDTNTGGRVFACRELLGPSFFVTYGDGLGNIDLEQLLAFHTRHGGAATMTTVPLPSPYGTVDFDDSQRVLNFREKPKLRDHFINAGFFVFEHRAFDQWAGEDLERDVLPALGSAGELYAWVHEGFWKSMDTYKDALELSALAEGTTPPWTGAERVP
jgi:glucose-1-phosphate cytidylyltransferase